VGGTKAVPRDRPFRLRIGAVGSFDSLWFEPFGRRHPGRGQVEVEVHATGLNFSDVLKAMGLYPGITDEIVPLGIECSGVVQAIGEGVERFRVGDAVLGVAPYSFASHALTADYALVHKPESLTHAEAATIPITFLTAYYGLVPLAHLQPGERVLIHAGAGGVGLAAIQIAQHIGAEIFATAGSDAKRDYLRSIGVAHVFNSRTVRFADEIMGVTGREGVDVVLNSLPGEAIAKSLAVLRAYGRFLEIGKTDIYQNRMIGLLPFQDNLSYFAIDLDRMLRQRPDYIRDMFAELMEHFQRGDYRALPRTEFPIPDTVAAFRYMAQRKNIGKIVVSVESQPTEATGRQRAEDVSSLPSEDVAVGEAEQRTLVRADGAYLITGGLGALGLQVADWLSSQGAKHLVLMSRRPPSESASARMKAWGDSGVAVASVQGDVADSQSLAGALAQIPKSFPPLRGVVHAAGVLADGALFDMDLDQLDRALAPKVRGAWNLHAATLESPLDFFVMFSSVACVLGSPGQANYAAGNQFLDALADYRRAKNLPATSINWGPWAGSGMAATAGRDEQIKSRGMDLLDADHALDLLERLLRQDVTHAVVMDAHWPDLLRLMSGRLPSLLGDIAQQQREEAGQGEEDQVDHRFRNELIAATMEERAAKLRGYFAEELARIMGVEAEDLDVEQPLNELGMDSLLAMELKNNLERRLAFHMPMAAFIEGPSVTTLAAHAAQALDGGGAEATAAAAAHRARSADAWTPLVLLRADGDAPPLFCVHPLGGDVSCYYALSQHFQDRPVYALRGRGSEGQFEPHRDLQEMIATYVQAIRDVQPNGPYHFGSWSAGGIFSYELARVLREQGEPVGLLMLFDTPLPSIYRGVNVDDEIHFLFDLGNFANWFSGSDIDVERLPFEQLRAMEEDERWQTLLHIATSHGVLPRDTTSVQLRRVVEAGRAHAAMILGYAIRPFDQTVHLVRPEQPDVLGNMTGQTLGHDLGWGEILGDRLKVHESPGDHFSMISGENAARLSEVLARCLPRSPVGAGQVKRELASR
jgi:myxalamid-type polyketide synthase MxaB